MKGCADFGTVGPTDGEDSLMGRLRLGERLPGGF
jgi:hypothetical protein